MRVYVDINKTYPMRDPEIDSAFQGLLATREAPLKLQAPSLYRRGVTRAVIAGCALVVSGLAGACGRLGYDRLGDSGIDGRAADAGPLTRDAGLDAPFDGGFDLDGGSTDAGTPWIISRTRLTTFAGFSWVDVAVDWTRRLAYLGSRETNVCFAVVDISDETMPVVLGTFDSAAVPHTPGNRCLGVALLSGDRLVVSAQDTNAVELFSLGADPRALAFSSLGAVRVISPRTIHVTRDESVYVARGRTGGFVELTFTPGPVLGRSWAPGCETNDVTIVGTEPLVVSGCWANDSPVQVVDVGTSTVASTFDMTYADTSGFWSAVTSPNGHSVFVGGWVGAFFDATVRPLRLTHRIDNPGAYRDCAFIQVATEQLLYCVTGDDLHVDEWDVTDIDRPRLRTHSALEGVTGSAYGLALDAAARRAVVVTNGGDLIMLDLDRLAPATVASWPEI